MVCVVQGGVLLLLSERKRTLDTNMNVVLLRLLDLAGIFIRFRERVKSLEVLDGHTRAGWRALGGGFVVLEERAGCEDFFN